MVVLFGLFAFWLATGSVMYYPKRNYRRLWVMTRVGHVCLVLLLKRMPKDSVSTWTPHGCKVMDC